MYATSLLKNKLRALIHFIHIQPCWLTKGTTTLHIFEVSLLRNTWFKLSSSMTRPWFESGVLERRTCRAGGFTEPGLRISKFEMHNFISRTVWTTVNTNYSIPNFDSASPRSWTHNRCQTRDTFWHTSSFYRPPVLTLYFEPALLFLSRTYSWEQHVYLCSPLTNSMFVVSDDFYETVVCAAGKKVDQSLLSRQDSDLKEAKQLYWAGR